MWTAWATTEDDVVTATDRYSRRQIENPVWDGRRVRLVCARNEVAAFQVIVEADDLGVSRLSLALPDLVRDGGRESFESDGSTGNGPSAGVIRLLRVLPDLSLQTDAAAGARTTGFPLAPRTSQAVLVELYARRDQVPGIYRGAVIVTADGERVLLPVELEVLDVLLPDTASIVIAVSGGDSTSSRFDVALHQRAHWYRVDVRESLTPPSARSRAALWSGDVFSTASGYDGPGEGVGPAVGFARNAAARAAEWRSVVEDFRGRISIMGPASAAARAGGSSTRPVWRWVDRRVVELSVEVGALADLVSERPQGPATPRQADDATERWAMGTTASLAADARTAMALMHWSTWAAFTRNTRGLVVEDAPPMRSLRGMTRSATTPGASSLGRGQASLWLATLRRAAQDHLYLTLAQERGLDTAVATALEQARRWREGQPGSDGPLRGDTLESARRSVGRALAVAAASPR